MANSIQKILILLTALLSLLALYAFPHYVMYVLGFHLVLISVLWAYKAVGELGLDNVRGQFYAIMAAAFLLQGLGFLMTGYGKALLLPFTGLLLYILARFFFFVANVRYIAHFQSLGYRLNLLRGGLVALITVLLLGITALTPNVVPIFRTFSPYILFILLDVGMAFIIFYNLLLLWGSEIAKRWAMGSVAIGTYLFADALFIGGAPPIYPVLLWILASTVMGLIATIRG